MAKKRASGKNEKYFQMVTPDALQEPVALLNKKKNDF